MRQIGSLHPTESVPVQADIQQCMLLVANTVQGVDWAAGSSNIGKIVRLSFMTTAAVAMNGFVNLESTRAALPSSGTSTMGSTVGAPVFGAGTFQVGGGSTGWSAVSVSSGYVVAEIWRP